MESEKSREGVAGENVKEGRGMLIKVKLITFIL